MTPASLYFGESIFSLDSKLEMILSIKSGFKKPLSYPQHARKSWSPENSGDTGYYGKTKRQLQCKELVLAFRILRPVDMTGKQSMNKNHWWKWLISRFFKYRNPVQSRSIPLVTPLKCYHHCRKTTDDYHYILYSPVYYKLHIISRVGY